MSDLDNEELEATRKANFVGKMSLEEAIEQLQSMLNINYNLGKYLSETSTQAIEIVLQELKEVTKEREAIYQDYQDLGKEFYNSVPKKKIEDKIEELEGTKFGNCVNTIEILHELLEEK